MKNLKHDIPAGIVVFLAALPLSLGIALASGAPLMAGIISGIIGGIVVGILSGSTTSVSGPAAGLATVVLASILKLKGFETFSIALIIAGLMQMAAGAAKGGIIADYIPSNVIKGLLAAIGILLILKQLPHALGYDVDREDLFSFFQPNGENTFSHLAGSFTHLNGGAVLISFVSISLLLTWDKLLGSRSRFLPVSLLVVLVSVVLNALATRYGTPLVQGNHLVNIPSVGIGELFAIKMPHLHAFANYEIWLVAFTIAIVASLETLINLEAVDNIDPHKGKSPPNRELVAQGIGNTMAGLLGGLPITSVIIRSSVNIEAGSRSKNSSILHGILLLMSVLTLTPLINQIPLSALASILIVAGYKLAKITVFSDMYRKGWGQFIPFIVTVAGILLTDLLIGVTIGLAVGIFNLLRSNFRNPFVIEKQTIYTNETIRIELPNQVSFLNKASIKSTLWSIPEESKVVIDASKTDYIDHDILEILQDFKTVVAQERRIQLNILGLKQEYQLFDHIEFINVLDKQTQQELTPASILELMREGNNRFINGKWSKKELKHQVDATSSGQFPMAVVLSCIDSRITPEVVFDSNLGDLISIRVAGNIVNDDIIGSMELSHKEIGTKLIIVMGHSNCGAVNAAIHGLKEGYIANITDKIKPAVDQALKAQDGKTSAKDVLENSCNLNLQNSLIEILKTSKFISSQIGIGSLGIVSAYYDTATGTVKFGELISSQAKLAQVA